MLNEKLSSIMLILWFNFILGLNLLSFVLNSVSYDILKELISIGTQVLFHPKSPCFKDTVANSIK